MMGQWGENALNHVARSGCSSPIIIQKLVESGCQIERFSGKGDDKHTPLYYAALYGNCLEARELLRAGASPHSSFASNQSPAELVLSRRESHPEMFREFLPYLPWYRRRLLILWRRACERRNQSRTVSR